MVTGRRLFSHICLLGIIGSASAFLSKQYVSFGFKLSVERAHISARRFAAPRYGPPMANPNDPNSFENRSSAPSSGPQTKKEFRELMNQVMQVSDPQHIPSVLTKQMELILNLSGEEGVATIEAILNEAREEQGDEAAERLEEVIDLILSFAEEFVQQAVGIEDANKKILGKIIRTISNKDIAGREREEALDDLLAAERDNITPGFLRHIEGECDRIAAAPKMTPESTRLLEILRIIQTRALEELGQDLGQAAQALGQLIGYESKAERSAVLEAGLAVQGVDFAREMVALTEEALEGFTRVNGGADPDLVECVEEIDGRLRRFLESEVGFQ
jgi:hypothetical protein